MTIRYNDMEMRRTVAGVDDNGNRVYEFAVMSDELDLGPDALESIRQLENTDATPYSRFKKLLCFRITLPKGKSSPTNQDLDRVADAIRRAQPQKKEPPKKRRWRN